MDREAWRAAVPMSHKELDAAERLNWTEAHQQTVVQPNNEILLNNQKGRSAGTHINYMG